MIFIDIIRGKLMIELYLYFIGALIGTYLISRLFLYIGKKINGGNHYVWANVLSLAVYSFIGAFTFRSQTGGYIQGAIQGALTYFLPQLIWLIYDFFQSKKLKTNKGEK